MLNNRFSIKYHNYLIIIDSDEGFTIDNLVNHLYNTINEIIKNNSSENISLDPVSKEDLTRVINFIIFGY